MGTLVLGAAPVAPVRYRHASGDDGDGCLACWFDQEEQGIEVPEIRPCLAPEDDPDEPGLCRWCSHTVEPVTAEASLLCSGCESSPCGCPA